MRKKVTLVVLVVAFAVGSLAGPADAKRHTKAVDTAPVVTVAP